MFVELFQAVCKEEKIAIKKWGDIDTTPEILLNAALEELGEIAHAINHKEDVKKTNQEIVETIGILSRMWNMVNGKVMK